MMMFSQIPARLQGMQENRNLSVYCRVYLVLCLCWIVLVRVQQTHKPPLHKQALSFLDFPNACALTQQALHYYLCQLVLLYFPFFMLSCLSSIFPSFTTLSSLLALFTKLSSVHFILSRHRLVWKDQMGSDLIAPRYNKKSFAERRTCSLPYPRFITLK